MKWRRILLTNWCFFTFIVLFLFFFIHDDQTPTTVSQSSDLMLNNSPFF